MTLTWLSPFRVKVGLLASLLTVAGLRLGGTGDISWLLPTTMFATASAAMIQNDWRDRYHDRAKGKTLASDQPEAFLILTACVWVLVAILIIAASLQDTRLATPLTAIAVASLVYSETRRIPLLPTILVATVSASPVLLAVFVHGSTREVWLLFTSATLIVLGREITKDIEDAEIDLGYKWTIPISIGGRNARLVSLVTVSAALMMVVGISPQALYGTPFVVLFGVELMRKDSPVAARRHLDALLLLATIWLIISN